MTTHNPISRLASTVTRQTSTMLYGAKQHTRQSFMRHGVFSAVLILLALFATLAGPVAVSSAQDSGDVTPAVSAPADTGPAMTVPAADPATQPATEPASVSAADEESIGAAPAEGSAAAEAEDAEVKQAAAAKAGPVSWKKNPYIKLLAFALVLIVPFLLAFWIANTSRMPQYTFRLYAIFFCLLAGLAMITFGQLKKGIDLSGGVILVYEVQGSLQTDEEAKPVDETDLKKPEDEKEEAEPGKAVEEQRGKVSNDLLTKTIAAISKRVNPGGVLEVSIKKLGDSEIQIIIPWADEAEVDRLEKIISDAGTLEFRIIASRRVDKDLVARAEQSAADRIYDSNNNLLGWWVPITDKVDSKGVPNHTTFTGNPDAVTRPSGELYEVLVKNDRYNVTGKYLVGARPGYDQNARPCINFTFSARGGQLFAHLTGDNLPNEQSDFKRQLGIVLSGYMESAPNIQSQIHEHGQITGQFSDEDVQDMVTVLEAGSLPAQLSEEPVTRMHIGPTLGADTIQKGEMAIVLSGIFVLVFMVFYYRFSGVVASFAVLLNMVMILGVMIMVKAAFTLPGLAGLVLTIGMAVDANVLIFERIREELDRGSSLRMAIRNGFQRATTTIIDANLTTLITGVILYYVGTEQIKGFAVTLVLGVVFSMFAAIYCSRAIFDIAEKVGLLKKLKMMRIVGHTAIDFIGMRQMAAVVSSVLIVIGLIAVVVRGRGMLDIDFVGGAMIEVVFTEPQESATIRTALGDLPDLQVQDLKTQEDPEPGLRFMINTANLGEDENGKEVKAEEYLNQVKAHLEESFGDKLEHYSMTYQVVDSPVGPAVTPGIEQAQFSLEFARKINYNTLRSYFDEEATKEVEGGELQADFNFVIGNEEYQGEGDNKSYPDWTATLDLPKAQAEHIVAVIQEKVNATPYFPSSSTIGGSVAGSTRSRAIWALSLALAAIIAYVWWRFNSVMFGVAAVIALVHDVLITLGALAISYWLAPFLDNDIFQVTEFKIGLPVLAAFLTIIGYSLNDTIVVFDRVREVRGKSPGLTAEMFNTSINQTLSRTLLTSITTLIVVLILYFFGGAGIHTFAFALVMGVIVGTYSSVFIASPALYWLFSTSQERQKK